MVSLNEFPDELLLKILELIPFESRKRASLVCKRWHRIVFNDIKSKIIFCIRWHEIEDNCDEDLNEKKRQISELYISGLTVLSQSFANICDVVLQSININFDNSCHLQLWQTFASRLQSLQLMDCIITDIELLQLISKCNQLIELRLNDNHYFVKNRDSKRDYGLKLISKVSKSLNNLKLLDFSGGKSFKLCDSLFVIIANQCESLEELNVSFCKIIFHSAIIRRYYFETEDYWKRATEYAFTFVILQTFCNKFGSNLKKLNLSETNICFEHLLELVNCSQLSQIQVIDVNNCIYIKEPHISQIRKLKPNIQFIYQN